MQAPSKAIGRGNPNKGMASRSNNPTTTTTRVPVRSRLTTPPPTHISGTGRKTLHGGAGDGGSVDGAGPAWKQPGRRLGGGNPKGSSAAASGAGSAVKGRLAQPTIASSLRANTTRPQRERGTPPLDKSPDVDPPKPSQAKRRVMSAAAKQAARERLWPSRPAGAGFTATHRKDKLTVGEESKPMENCDAVLEAELDKEVPAHELLETGVQTNESEILDHGLLLGTVRMVSPSRRLVEQIDRERRELKAKTDRQSARRFEPHEQEEELHLDELKEFTERNAVTKRIPKRAPAIPYASYDNQYQNVFKSMDDFFAREVPKSESVTNIQERFKRKERELMSLFDNVETIE
ncbi:hypothetical protein KR009_006777 [Drosophila setifemur]|nr:hypothetical protein KR009_006777 [Drosophila setifemur]